jgi:predicted extracellular nuclease
MATFRAMMWNVENFFPAGTANGLKTQAEYEAKVISLAMVIDAQAADVLALQEVGDTDVLGDLQDALTHKIHDLAVGLDPVQISDAQGAGR